MVQRFRLPRRTLASALSAVLLSAAAASPAANAQYTCFPTCTTNDGRMLALSGSGNNAFAGNAITIGIGLPPGSTGIELGIFDGETGGNWDQGTTALEYNLYTDKNGDGSELNLVASFTGGQMTNNAWWSTTIPQDSRSLASNGNYVYMLEVTMPAGVGHTSAFKIRTNGTITVKAHQSFSISAPLTNFSDGAIIYPDFNATDLMNPANYYRRNYDGIWNIYLDVPQPSTAL
jgi:hypothetical protein